MPISFYRIFFLRPGRALESLFLAEHLSLVLLLTFQLCSPVLGRQGEPIFCRRQSRSVDVRRPSGRVIASVTRTRFDERCAQLAASHLAKPLLGKLSTFTEMTWQTSESAVAAVSNCSALSFCPGSCAHDRAKVIPTNVCDLFFDSTTMFAIQSTAKNIPPKCTHPLNVWRSFSSSRHSILHD